MEKTNIIDIENFKHSASSVNTFIENQSKWVWRHIMGIRPPFLTKITIFFCQFGQFSPPKLGKIPLFSHFCWFYGYTLYETQIGKWVLRSF